MKHNTRVDSRTIRTKEKIWETFRSMILEKDYTDITVTELASRVGIQRKTFYLHYESMDSLFLELQTKVVDRVSNMIAHSIRDLGTLDFETMKYHITELIDQDTLLYHRILFSESYLPVYSRIYNGIVKQMTPHIHQAFALPEEEAIIITTFIFTCCFDVMRNCHKNNPSISDEKLNRMLFSLIHTGIQNFS